MSALLSAPVSMVERHFLGAAVVKLCRALVSGHRGLRRRQPTSSSAGSKRCAGGKVVQRPVLYLGEINDNPDHAVFLEERTESGRPAPSMRFRTVTPMAASVR
jgi:hypothetical protein